MLNFTAIDFETANPKRGSVCQVGIARVRDGRIVGSAGSLVTPPPGLETFHPRNIEVHGIRSHQVIDAPDWPTILDWLNTVCADDTFVAHNAAFERSVFTQASQAHGIAPPAHPMACTMKLSRRLGIPTPNHKLTTLMPFFGLRVESHHDAEADAVMCAQLAIAMANHGNLTHIDQFLDPRN